ncbi:bifunctional 2-polyprenyl-6-hydroxyphenol methylase/3-demethylubiquinol 3-O-methyltransferase UbiG [Synechococcus sp. 1G10]|uniref:class I SAM-dependent methyltransferase n=1 Tax=Synechococcus sp. 1G10 TaxID=2025605 RepID=UPI0018E91B15|nr:class I SAM-dependent methyltransferase [Synechococcus sp. 1G10]
MDMDQLRHSLRGYSGRSLEQRAAWYGPAAEAYARARPAYDPTLLGQVITAAGLTASSRVLELGCGPGTATAGLAPLGCSMLCLEPNPAFCCLARQHCGSFSNVTVEPVAFEDWPLQPEAFDVVLAASSFHWIDPAVACAKAAAALRPGGGLILLWNKELQPSEAFQQRTAELYAELAPQLHRREERADQVAILNTLAEALIDRRHFERPLSGLVDTSFIYSAERYLDLLDSYSGYLQLDPAVRQLFFQRLRLLIANEWEGRLPLTMLSSWQVARKASPS